MLIETQRKLTSRGDILNPMDVDSDRVQAVQISVDRVRAEQINKEGASGTSRMGLPKETNGRAVSLFEKFPSHHLSTIKQDIFETLQKWEGVVVEKRKGYFLARLIDLTESRMEEEAEFPLEEVPDEDKILIEPGAVFYWNIGYLNKRGGQKIRASMIRFRRLPAWTYNDVAKAKQEAEDLQRFFE